LCQTTTAADSVHALDKDGGWDYLCHAMRKHDLCVCWCWCERGS
jgi:hypothetical protein